MDQVRVRPGMMHPVDRGLAAVRGAVVHDPEHPIRGCVRLGSHHLGDQPGERFDAGGVLAATSTASSPRVPPSNYAGCATPARPTTGVSRSTAPAMTTTKNRSS